MTVQLEPRRLPPVEPVPLPERFSMTLLDKAQRCKRSAYLYVKYKGGSPAHELDFGTAFHIVQERLLNDLIQMGEKNLYAAELGEDPVHAKKNVASLAHAIVDEVLRDHPNLTLPLEGGKSTPDKLRECAYHLAVGNDIDPDRLVAVEKMFALDLACGMRLVGKLDALESLSPERLRVSDAKTQYNVEPEGGIKDSFQLKTYSVLAVFGYPLDDQGNPEPTLGRGVQEVEARETYPRHLDERTDLIRESGAVFGRTELQDFRVDLERLADDLLTRFAETHDFPATPGTKQCNRCPCRAECPLPSNVRDYAGAIDSDEKAARAAEWHDRVTADAKAVWKEMREYVSVNGPFAWGSDLEYAIEPQVKNSVDRQGMADAAREAAETGADFDPEDHVKQQVSSVLKKRPRGETDA